jgi:hypothetical protein
MATNPEEWLDDLHLLKPVLNEALLMAKHKTLKLDDHTPTHAYTISTHKPKVDDNNIYKPMKKVCPASPLDIIHQLHSLYTHIII